MKLTMKLLSFSFSVSLLILQSDSFPEDCKLIKLFACEINSCAKQSINGLANPDVCQFTCTTVGPACGSWTYFKEKGVTKIIHVDIKTLN